MKPFREDVISESVVIRTFTPDISESELKWHWDREDRKIEPLNENDWKFQYDNCLPFEINKEIYVHAGDFHRVIKGTTNLIVKITKYNETRTHF